MKNGNLHWFAAEYHFPSTYSCRLPLSSAASALISPGPGPATVRLALIRVGIELFGPKVVQEELFPWIRSARLRVRPPERVAISEQVVRAYKTTEKGGAISVAESVVYREMAHAEGSLMLYIEFPQEERDRWHLLLRSISYWGQASSFTTCLEISEDAPVENECVQPLREVSTSTALQPFFSCILSEFRTSSLSWHNVVPREEDSPLEPVNSVLKWEIYVWPLQVMRQTSRSTLLVRSPVF